MSDEEILAEAKEDGDCLECGGWGRFWTINRDGRYGPLYPSSLPCAECDGTGKADG